MDCLRVSGLAGDFNSLILFRSVAFKVTRKRGIKLVTGGNAKGAALLGVVTKGRSCSDKTIIFQGSLQINCLRRVPRCPSNLAILRTYFCSPGRAIHLVTRCRRTVTDNSRSGLRSVLLEVSGLGT